MKSKYRLCFFSLSVTLMGLVCSVTSRASELQDYGSIYHHVDSRSDTLFSVKTFEYKQIDSQELKLDVYFPEGYSKMKNKLSAIIFFHGGGWTSGNRNQFAYQCKFFAARGMVAITADYRLLVKDRPIKELDKTVCIEDAKSAVRWIIKHSTAFNIDKDKLVLGGGSAGGHLAMMVALSGGFNAHDEDSSIEIKAKALVLLNPGFDFRNNPDREVFNLISSKAPPTIMFFGTEDNWAKPGKRVRDKMVNNQVVCEFWMAPGQKHAFGNTYPWNLATCIKAQEFLTQLRLTNGEKRNLHSDVELIKNIKD